MRVDDAPASVRRHRSSGSHQGMRQATLIHIPPFFLFFNSPTHTLFPICRTPFPPYVRN